MLEPKLLAQLRKYLVHPTGGLELGITSQFYEYAMLGDAHLRFYITKCCIAERLNPNSINENVKYYASNANLAEVAKKLELEKYFLFGLNYSDWSERVYASMFECLVGVCALNATPGVTEELVHECFEPHLVFREDPDDHSDLDAIEYELT